MRLLAIALLVAVSGFAESPTFSVTGTDAAPWAKIFTVLGIAPAAPNLEASIIVAGANAALDAKTLSANHIVIVEGSGAIAQTLGFVAKSEQACRASKR